ncbi:MAG: nucleotide exchange factor GrpE [Calditrichaeota bacterium]|nr:nucleotide exchange factor GrpE [Calditrichota bacterium]
MTEKTSTTTELATEEKPGKATERKRAPRATVKSLRAEIEALTQQLAVCNDRLLRKAAEFDNYKKRVQREVADIVVNANADLVRALLPILDDMERALQQDPQTGTFEQFREGVRLIWEKMNRVLQERGLVPIEAVGHPFDPERHEALMQTESEGTPANTVVMEHQRGYEFQGRVLRPAKVVVSK